MTTIANTLRDHGKVYIIHKPERQASGGQDKRGSGVRYISATYLSLSLQTSLVHGYLIITYIHRTAVSVKGACEPLTVKTSIVEIYFYLRSRFAIASCLIHLP